MRTCIKIMMSVVVVLAAYSCVARDAKSTSGKLTSESAKFSYALGLEVGASLQNIAENTELDVEILSQAIKDHLSGNKPLLSADEATQVKQTVFGRLQKKGQAERDDDAQKNLEEQKAFLKKNGARKEVQTTESGLQYEVITKGSGPRPQKDDVVTVHYTGTLLDGTIFDSSRERGKPATFGLSQVIPGWTEALQLMQAGSTYKLYIPSKLAYGERGAGQKVGPNACLVFEVELLSIKDKNTAGSGSKG